MVHAGRPNSGCRSLILRRQSHLRRADAGLRGIHASAILAALFRALAGLWPWGSGTVTHPADEEILYIPRTPYLPPGTLREVLAYPKPTSVFDTGACADALARVGLKRLVPLLDTTQRWDHELNEDEQHALNLARVITHQAPSVIIDE